MVNHKEILRLKSLGLSNTDVAAACGCGRNTVSRTVQRATGVELSWELVKGWRPEQVTQALFPADVSKPTYRMPDYEKVHREISAIPICDVFLSSPQIATAGFVLVGNVLI